MTTKLSDSHADLPLATGALLISLSPIFVKAVSLAGVGPTAIGFWRTSIGAVVLLLVGFWMSGIFKITRAGLGWSVFAGCAFAADLYCWHKSILITGAGMATILGNTQVFASAVISFFVFREKLTLRFFLAALAGLIGVALLTGAFSEGINLTTQYLWGVTLGLLTGIAYAVYITGLKLAARTMPAVSKAGSLPIIFYSSIVTSIILALLAVFGKEVMQPPTIVEWGLLIALGVIVQVLGWWLITNSLPRVSTNRASLLLLLQPTAAVVMGSFFFAEMLDSMQIAGAVLTLASIYFGSRK
jgi:drug/metabolite transporter (DMT)-like permease